MEQWEKIDQDAEDTPHATSLHILRGMLDKRAVGSTSERRVVSVLQFCMSTEFPVFDRASAFASFFPQGNDLLEWYHNNLPDIDKLRREDKRDYFTDRWDVEEAAKQYSDSVWLKNVSEAVRMLPLDPEVANADIAMKLLYIEAFDAYDHAPHPPHTPLTAA